MSDELERITKAVELHTNSIALLSQVRAVLVEKESDRQGIFRIKQAAIPGIVVTSVTNGWQRIWGDAWTILVKVNIEDGDEPTPLIEQVDTLLDSRRLYLGALSEVVKHHDELSAKAKLVTSIRLDAVELVGPLAAWVLAKESIYPELFEEGWYGKEG